MIKYLLIIVICLGLTSCTLNMSMTQATGRASDVVDTHHQQEYDTQMEGSLL